MRLQSLDTRMLYLITKLQNLKAIHNNKLDYHYLAQVVSNYKITKSESYSQLATPVNGKLQGCI